MQPTSPFTPRPPSPRARFARVATRATLRPLERLIPDNALGIAITRRVLATLMAGAAVTEPGVQIRAVQGRITGEWARPSSPRADAVMLYIHGSGYNLCSTRTHRPLVTRIAEQTQLEVFSTEYRLAPDHVFPAAAEDVERAYDWLLDQGWRPDQVVVAGDSAGGHLVLDLALVLLRAGRELPACLVMFSPLADPTGELCRRREEMRPDPMLSADGVRRLIAHYLGDTDPRHPRLTHVVAEHERLPPTLIQAGGAEMLAGDAHHIYDMLAASGTEVTLEVWPGQMHVFQAAARVVPEADVALRRATRFISTTLDQRAALGLDRFDQQTGVIA